MFCRLMIKKHYQLRQDPGDCDCAPVLEMVASTSFTPGPRDKTG